MSLFKVNHDWTAVLNPEAVKLCQYLPQISKKEFLYIALAYDNSDGPFRQRPPDERINLAKKKVFGTMDIEPETPLVKKAINEYKELIFDVRREVIDTYKKRIVSFQRESLKEDLTVGKLKDIDAAIKFLMLKIEEMENELNTEEKTSTIVKGDKKLSFVEQWQLNQKRKREQSF